MLSRDIASVKDIRLAVVALVAVAFAGCGSSPQPSARTGSAGGDDSSIERAFSARTSNVQVEGQGVVTRVLSDDVSAPRHQRFIVRLASGQTVLIAHNIDAAPRIDDLSEGDRVEFSGEYVWNAEGGLVHWTHRDPGGRHVAGWLIHDGR